ncbi:MAG: PAS domain S-box protein, partial [Planctomycetota bacterium]|nr:PAS domain S-box protein [Planctomycetota bacterium]
TAVQFQEHDRQALGSADGLRSVELLEQSDGVVHQSVISKFAIPRPNGGSPWVGGIAIDVTGQVQAEETVRKTSSFRETIIRTAAEGICVCYPIPDFPYVAFSVWNERMDEITGYSCEEINRLGWYQSLYPDEEVRNRAIERMSRMRVGDDLHSEEWEIVRKDGERRIVAISTSLVEMEGGVENVVGLMLDVTDRKRAEEERRQLDAKIRQTQQLESLAVLAGGVAHDFNNLLTTIRGCAELSLMELPENSPICPMLRDIEEAANQAANLTQQMLAYSGRGKFVVEKVDLATIVRDMGQLMLSAVSKKVVIQPRLETATIEADATQIRQVVMNLIVNAADAMNGGEGVIELRTGVRFATVDELRSPYIPGELPAGRYSFVEVSDNGAGMDALTASRIFEPFFTTKFTGRGLGLAAVLGIVRGHHGSIQVCSEPGKGTTFRVLFPYLEVATSPATPPVASSPMPRGAGTILVVEDEPSVRHFIQRVLGGAGFTVLTAEDGLQGLEVFSQHQCRGWMERKHCDSCEFSPRRFPS